MGNADTSDSPPDYVLIHEWCLRKRHEKRPIYCFKIQDENTEFRTMSDIFNDPYCEYF